MSNWTRSAYTGDTEIEDIIIRDFSTAATPRKVELFQRHSVTIEDDKTDITIAVEAVCC
jgi:hypothetical protein